MLLRFAQILTVAVALAVIPGCGNMNRQPRYNVEAPLEITPFKRYAKWGQRDYLYRFVSRAYTKVDEPITKRLSPDQVSVLERHGQPDYIRTHWKATTGEVVDEWAYWDRDVVVQYVQRELVWEGPLTDMDRYRIRYGTPVRAWSQSYEDGVRRDIWEYQGILNAVDGRVVTFSDEALVSTQNY